MFLYFWIKFTSMRIKLLFNLFIYSLPVLLLTSSCDEVPKENEPDFQESLSSFTSTIDKVDSTLDLMDKMQQDMDQVEKERALGNITDEEAVERLNEINNTTGRQIAKSANNHPVNGLPRWSRKLGLTEPTGLNFDRDFSQSTSENNSNEGFNSIIMVYHGDYEMAMSQAEIIAKRANIPLSQDYEDALTLSREYGIETIKGASYMNFEIGGENNPKYNISITVDDDGTLTINATDTEALFRQLEGN